jgi:hypothetical protein
VPFSARPPDEITQLMQARTVASSRRLTDISEGGNLGTILGTIAEDVGSIELRVQDWLKAHFLGASGADLDDRVAQLPKEFPRRRGPRAATGGGLTLVRSATSSALVVPAGAVIVGRSDTPGVYYTNVSPIEYSIGQSSAPGVGEPAIRVRCITPGEAGNGDVGVIDIIQSPTDVFRSVTSTTILANGTEGEKDEEVRRRAKLWVSSLMGWTPAALEGLAYNYTNANNESVRHARAFTDPTKPGYTELVVDDGFGMTGYTQLAASRSGTIPDLVSGTRHQLWFAYPAVGNIRLTLDGVVYGPESDDWIAILERGVLITVNSPTVPFTAGLPWSISGHYVYNGIIADLQAYLDEVAVGSGLRVRVVPPSVQEVTLSANRVAVHAAVKRAIIAHCVNLRPGDPLIIFQLCADLEKIPGVENVVFDQTDKYVGSLRDKIMATTTSITLR